MTLIKSSGENYNSAACDVLLFQFPQILVHSTKFASLVGVSQGLSLKMKEILLALLVINVSSQTKIEDERYTRF